MEPVNLRWIVDMGIREARLYAEKYSCSEIYIFTDDDVLPWGKDWVKTGLERMLRNPEYAACSTMSVIAEEMLNHTPPDTEIYEVPCVGAPMWIRKGYMADLPEFEFVSECVVIHNHLRIKGKKEGFFNGLRHVHLGFGFATDPKLVRGY